jgi:hypothetical protein
MRKPLLILLLLSGTPMFAATWYAGASSASINAVTWYPTSTGSCTGSGTSLVWGAQADGDIFNANGCTAIAVNVDPGSSSVHVTLTTDATNGGAFTYSTATNLTMHASIIATKTTAITVSGSTGGLTIVGDITGGSVNSQVGVSDSHTAITVNVTGNIIAGSASGANGYTYSGANGGVAVTGSCQGSNVNTGTGCSATNAGVITVTGSLIHGIRSQATYGTIRYTPGATGYILYPKDASYTLGTLDSHAQEMPTDPGTANVRLGTAYGTFTGTMPVDGGGSAVSATGGW